MNKKKHSIIIICLTSLLLVMTIYFINNYNKFKIYIFKGSNDMFEVFGNVTFSKKIHLLNITKIRYKKDDIKLKIINISLVANKNDKERLIFGSGTEGGSIFSLQEYINMNSQYTIFEQYGYEEYFDSEIIENFKDIIYLKIEMVDEFNKKTISTIKVNSECYSNNKLFYKKVNHI